MCIVENVEAEVRFMRKLGQVTRETVCYLESVFLVTLLEGTMTAAINDTAYLGPGGRPLPALPHAAECGRKPFACRGWEGGQRPPRLYNFCTPVPVSDFYIFKY